MHFAAKCYVGESVRDPEGYYETNLIGAWNLLSSMNEVGCQTLVMSSTCAVYGVPQEVPIPDDHSRKPISPYGRSKLAVEFLAEDFSRAYGFRVGRLRYFNAAGASQDASIGELHEPETHVIPLVMRATQPGAQPFTIYGTDYDTPDGTCVRDYVHVEDLADAHLLALKRCEDKGGFACNLGTGRGFSVREVISSVERVTGLEVSHRTGDRREGDPPVLVSGGRYAGEVLGWEPKRGELDLIVEDAWRFEEAQQLGAESP
jgi:UDP-glucose-4-epimerase GalE